MVWGLLVWGWRKGIVNRETQRNPMLLRLARSEKGIVNRESHQNRLPFSVRSWRKDSENRETQRNPMLLRLARSEKGNENRESCRNPLLFPRLTILPGEVSYSSCSISFSHLPFGHGCLPAFSCCGLK